MVLHALDDVAGLRGGRRARGRGPRRARCRGRDRGPRTSPTAAWRSTSRSRPSRRIAAHAQRPLLQALVADHVEDREADLARHGLPPNVLKYSMPLAKAAAISRCRDDGGERMPVADRLAHRHDVRHDALRLEAPEAASDAAEADLDLVGDADGAGRPGVPVGGREVAGRKLDLAAARQQALAEEGRGPPCLVERSGGLPDVGRELLAARGILAAVEAPVVVGHRDDAHVRRPAASPGPVELVGADVDERLRVAVVRAVDDDDRRAGPSGRAASRKRELVGLAPRADEEADRERLRQSRREPLRRSARSRGGGSGCWCSSTAICRAPGLDDARVAVADVGDVVDHVEDTRGPSRRRGKSRRPGRSRAAPGTRARATGRAGAGVSARDAGGVLGGRPERRAGKAAGSGWDRERARARRRARSPRRRPLKSPSRSSMSVTIWKWTWGGQSPLPGGAPIAPMRCPRATGAPGESVRSESGVRWP